MYGSLKNTIHENGYFPIPLNGKIPAVRDFLNIKEVPKGNDDKNLGVVCGKTINPVCAIDIDITDKKISNDLLEYILKTYGETVYRVGKDPKVLAVFRTDIPFRKKFSETFDIGRIEILGNGQQFAAFGNHPDTKKPYTWPGILGSIEDIKYNELPLVYESDINNILSACNNFIKSKGFNPVKKENDLLDNSDFEISDFIEPIGIPHKEIEDILTNLNADCSRDNWRNIGMSIHYETKGSIEGFELWDRWSATGSKYNEVEMSKQWDSFGHFTGTPITGAFLKKLSNKLSTKKVKHENIFKSISWDSSRFLDEPPEIPMIIEDFLPKGIVSLFYSMGGAGKSTLIIYLSCIIAACKKFPELNLFGFKTNPGKVVILTAEDPDIVLNKRYISIIKGLSNDFFIDYTELRKEIDKNLFIVSTFGKSTYLYAVDSNGGLETTEHYTDLTDALEDIQDIQLLVIDTKTRFSPAEGLGNVMAAQEITYYESIALKINCSVMMLHHTSKASRDGSQGGAQSYRGVTALYDNSRAAWFLKPLGEKEAEREGININNIDNYLFLENSKNSYIRKHKSLIINRNGYSYNAQTQTPTADKNKSEFDNNMLLLQDENKGLNQTEIINLLNIGRRKTVIFLEMIEKAGYIEKKKSGKSCLYQLTEEGKIYNLEVV